MSDEILAVGIVLWVVLFAGSPDLMDAIVAGLMK